MKIEIDNSILKKADQCRHNGICHAIGGKPHCRITDTVNGSVFFTDGRNPCNCPYQHSFGTSFICTCPVRQDIYKKYGC